MPVVLLVYILLFAALIALQTVLFRYGRSPQSSWADALGQASTSFWEPSSISTPNQAPLFYAAAGVVFFAGTLLPVLLLGSFVFKLFRHDPILWRRSPSLELIDDELYGVVRIHNRFNTELVDLHLCAWLRVRSRIRPNVVANHPLKLSNERWPYARPGVPFSMRFRAMSREDFLENGCRMPLVAVQDHPVDADSVLLVQVSGMIPATGESFVSVRRFPVSGVSAMQAPDVGVQPDLPPRKWPGWKSIQGDADTFLFVYGSLLVPESMSETLTREVQPDDFIDAALDGYQAAWNVASDPAVKGRVYADPDAGETFSGMIVYLGLEQNAQGRVHGRLLPVTLQDLARLDARELSYTRNDVTSSVHLESPLPVGSRVYVNIPRADALDRFRDATQTGTAVVLAEYLNKVRSAVRLLDASAAESLAKIPDGVQVKSLRRVDSAGG